MIPDLIKKYVETGIVRLVSREFPLSSHPLAQKAAEAAVCAGRQGKYWEMHDKLFASSSEWSATGADSVAFYKKYAGGVGIDTATFTACLDGGEAALAVQGDLLAGEAFGVNATPYFFVGEIPIRGGLSVESFGVIIEYVAAGGQTPEIVPPASDYHVRGNLNQVSAITVAFVDYAGAEDAQHALEVLPQLVSTYINTGKLAYILHPWATDTNGPSFAGAVAAECAGEQGKYWEMHDQLFQDQANWTKAADPRSVTVTYAGSLGLDKTAFQACLASSAAKLRVQAGAVVGMRYGVPGAPVFLFNNGTGQQGSPTFDEFKSVIDSIINQ